MLQGVTMLQVEAMPIWGLEKSSSVNPTARSIARLGACATPSTTTLEYLRGSADLSLWLDIAALIAFGAAIITSLNRQSNRIDARPPPYRPSAQGFGVSLV